MLSYILHVWDRTTRCNGAYSGEQWLKPSCSVMHWSLATVLCFHRSLSGKVRPSKNGLFIWTATLGKILTLERTYGRVFCDNRDVIACAKSKESTDHALFHCQIVSTLWQKSFGLFRLVWVMPRRLADLLACWKGHFESELSRLLWMISKLYFLIHYTWGCLPIYVSV